jgi:hypothetical protein
MERATLNVSPAGAFISSRNLLDKYEIFDLIISSPDRHIKTKAEVVWSNSHHASADLEMSDDTESHHY